LHLQGCEGGSRKNNSEAFIATSRPELGQLGSGDRGGDGNQNRNIFLRV
jgi:hypothetical protein